MRHLVTISVLILVIIGLTIGCDATNPAVVDDSPPIDVNSQIYDTTGVANGLTFVDGMPRVSTQEYLYSISEGFIPGHYIWVKTGYNPNVGTTEETVWGYSTEYTFPTAPIRMEVVSSDNTKDIPGGTGAITLYITYLDGNYVQHIETIALNGTTTVGTTATDIFRVNNFRCASVGADGKPTGNITLRAFGGGTVYSYILAGYTRARNIVYTVPADMTLYITSSMWSCAEAAKGVRFINKATYDDANDAMLTPGIFFMPFGESTLYNTALLRQLEVPTKLPEKTDIKVTTISTQAGAIADIVLRGWLEDN
jgi:hypothetical protein